MADERKVSRKYWEDHAFSSIDGIEVAHNDYVLPSIIIGSRVELEELVARLEYLGYKLGWLDQADTEVTPTPTGDGWAYIDAGSEYGSRRAWYQIVSGVLVLQNEGNHDNLAGNELALDFEGLTLEQAYAKARALDSEPVGHDYDGCHACKWGIEVREVSNPADYGAEFLTYQEPAEGEQLRKLIQAFLGKKASFADLREAINA